ncbi:uncharacterized protein LOC119686268 [Teleopsis dalmanni]|uniref:uncharacterized protein LOC119686268 n=1 Tax=Teleopsis dalmanni TaxID=139649 RepID=UPI0018CCB023|nr:uncharacterized protein LOC119686268 [Teleopsis dalmanni]
MPVQPKVTLALLFLTILTNSVIARPYKDSPIQTIIVPYHRTVISGQAYQYPKLSGENRHVLIPDKMDMVPNFNLNQGAMAVGSKKGVPLNFADGAYPVYYMPGNANGRFNGQISLLT